MNADRKTLTSRAAPMLLVCACALAAACSQAPSRPDLGGRCDASALGWAVGKPLDEAAGRKLFKQSGAGLWRVVAPDNTFSNDQRDDRLNVRVDAANVVTGVDCG
ncbi:hypothetical protein ABIE09_004708 [Lysobacter enzymogenes]|uniref:I78 family peptidase inhibitor n=1 Tax=Lysobacter enzymogenes TaxID=69 RepID=UPI0008980E30|nr:I78 family peptidase inhibitor [Lysobacter enzymogenes]SDX97825.1 Peptidase inhibitor I78 family protein [Lysobacter enzymogenes]